MRAKIDKNGFLWMSRKTKYKIQMCPLTNGITNCGDWCPLFQEPDEYGYKLIRLTLCKTSYVLDSDDFVDEREL